MLINNLELRSAIYTLIKSKKAGSGIVTSELTNAMVTVVLAILERQFPLSDLEELNNDQ